MNLFLHMPKCAGTSVREVVLGIFGSRVIFDYETFFSLPSDVKEKVIKNARGNPTVVDDENLIYGHFYPIKYLGNAAPRSFRLVTILREPIDRLVSHWTFWQEGNYDSHYLWRKMKAEEWSIERFIMSSEMQNFYSQYLTLCPVRNFSYIGLYENLEESVQRCVEIFGVGKESVISVPWLRRTERSLLTSLSESFVSEAREFHQDDCDLYEYARSTFHA